jgi:hypothetical protein
LRTGEEFLFGSVAPSKFCERPLAAKIQIPDEVNQRSGKMFPSAAVPRPLAAVMN